MTSYALQSSPEELGQKGEDFETIIDGEPHTVAIYTRIIDENWALGTAVDESGRILSRQQFPRNRYK